ncbi:MAG: ATP-binding protein, partial [Eubacterium sp.]
VPGHASKSDHGRFNRGETFGLDENNDFRPAGVYDLQDLQKRVTAQCQQMHPPVRAYFTSAEYRGVWICSAEIPAVDVAERPCYYMGAGRQGGSYIRVGDVDFRMTNYELYSYEAFRKHEHDDERIAARADVTFMDMDRITVYVAEQKLQRPGLSRLPKDKILELLGLFRNGHATLAGLMNFGLYPQGFFPQFGITAVVIPGCAMGDVDLVTGGRFLDNKRIEGTLAEMVQEAVRFCVRNMKVSTIIDPATGERKDRTEYPVTAVREAVLNAVIHRDYSVYTEGTPIQLNMFSDRIEIHSPGNLYGRMTVDQLGTARPELRNPTLAVIAESQTNAENRYSGIPTMRRLMREWKLPEPVFENRRNEFVVTLYNRRRAAVDYPNQIGESEILYGNRISAENKRASGYESDPSQELLAFCTEPKTVHQITDHLGMKTAFYVRKHYIQPLLDKGKLAMTHPETPKSRYQKYYTLGELDK